MTRTFSSASEDSPRLDRAAITEFFEQRAVKAETLGPVRAVIYQDKDPDLAERRDAAEKALLLPKMQLESHHRVLDIGCGTGRWAQALLPQCSSYHGADMSPGLVRIAEGMFAADAKVRFSVCAADALSLDALGEREPFDRLLCAGVLMYLNDDEALRALEAMAEVAAPEALIVLREPLATNLRLTITEHFSEDMEQNYNAMYRSEPELIAMIDQTLSASGFRVRDRGDVYLDAALNNRADTKQRWIVIAR
ncbi:class I SAM-dependent methyltransferase [Hephaestia sp. GCM10023244]|uniref:class I SAM-dependent methyltransferase n=1 Tax=unclassified Hephaestia TaxID=2631281 RepID=UPI0020776883|nr:class I SAM-dependent methyltransferase [Hephaestia sp. MAHUQ-44]MCM8732533.1 class I SAM-dependent methyltransferase [Hephaestia sp. MAHUQ-44]